MLTLNILYLQPISAISCSSVQQMEGTIADYSSDPMIPTIPHGRDGDDKLRRIDFNRTSGFVQIGHLGRSVALLVGYSAAIS